MGEYPARYASIIIHPYILISLLLEDVVFYKAYVWSKLGLSEIYPQ